MDRREQLLEQHGTSRNRNPVLLSLALFLLVYVIHDCSRVLSHADSQWTLFTAKSLIQEGNFNLDEYRTVLEKMPAYGVSEAHGHIIQYFPLANAILAVPFLILIEEFPTASLRLMPGLEEKRSERILQREAIDVLHPNLRHRIERAIASFFVALTTLVIFLSACRLGSCFCAMLIALTFAFASPAWSTASRALWQHAPSMLAIAVSVYCLIRARVDNENWAIWTGPLAVLGYIIRPTNSILVLAIALYVSLRHRRMIIRAALLGGIVGVCFVVMNLHVTGAPLAPYFLPSRVGNTSDIWNALAAHFVSPSRGLFVFSPIFLLSVVGGFIACRDKEWRGLYVLMIGSILLHWITISTFPVWWGGHGYGPRLFTDMSVYFAFLLLPVVSVIEEKRHFLLAGAFLILFSASAWIHYRGATRPATLAWNYQPSQYDLRERAWDWKDPQFLR